MCVLSVEGWHVRAASRSPALRDRIQAPPVPRTISTAMSPRPPSNLDAPDANSDGPYLCCCRQVYSSSGRSIDGQSSSFMSWRWPSGPFLGTTCTLMPSLTNRFCSLSNAYRSLVSLVKP